MSWLYTYNDGCNGQRVKGTISDEVAVALLLHYCLDHSAESAQEALNEAARHREEMNIEGEIILLPLVDDCIDDQVLSKLTAHVEE